MGGYSRPTRLQHLAPSQIRENMRLAAEVGAINLAQGRPDFPTAPALKRAATQAIADNHNQYSVTWGVAELRQAVASSLAERFGLNIDPETDLTITCGVTEAIVAAMLALVEPGDEVILLEPAHENYMPAVRFAGGVPRYLTLRPPTFELPLDELKQLIGSKTKALILNTPHNPSGRVFSRQELTGLLELTEKHGVYVITDEIYDRLVYPPHEHVCPASIASDPSLLVTTGGISKIYAVTGWRLGYLAAPSKVSAAVRTVHDYLTICAPTPFQHAALEALGFPPSYYSRIVDDFQRRRTRMLDALRSSGFESYTPEGAYYVLASFDGWEHDGDSSSFTRRLITDAKVAVVPGEAFYLGTPEVGRNLVRFAFAKTLDVLDDVAGRLARAYARS